MQLSPTKLMLIQLIITSHPKVSNAWRNNIVHVTHSRSQWRVKTRINWIIFKLRNSFGTQSFNWICSRTGLATVCTNRTCLFWAVLKSKPGNDMMMMHWTATIEFDRRLEVLAWIGGPVEHESRYNLFFFWFFIFYFFKLTLFEG